MTTSNGAWASRAGYTLSGWNTASGGSGTAVALGGSFTMPAADATLYAQWTVNPSFQLSYDSNGGVGSAPSPSSQVSGSSVTASSGAWASRAGYTLSGWNTASGGSGTAVALGGSFTMPASDATLYAQWTLIPTYALSYDVNGGSGTAPDPVSYAASTSVTTSSGAWASRAGYTLTEWNTKASGGGGTSVVPGASFTMPAAATTLYARWTALPSYTIKYFANSPGATGTPPPDGTYVLGTPYIIEDQNTLALEGYTFEGWNTDNNGKGTQYSAGDSYAVASNQNLFAVWAAIPTYSLSYDANTGTGTPPSPASFAANASVTTSTGAWASKAGYTLTAWTTKSDGTGTSVSPGSAFTMPASATVLYAKWTLNAAYSLSYSANTGTGTPPSPTSKVSGTSVTSSDGTWATKAGYSVTKWNTKADGTGVNVNLSTSFTMFAADTTLYAQWTINAPYTLSYSANGGSGTPPGPTSETSGMTVTASDGAWASRNGGYKIAGWSTAANGSGTVIGLGAEFTMPAQDTTLYAVWSKHIFDIKYFANSPGATGTLPPDGTYMTGGPAYVIEGPNTLALVGYVFDGWNTDNNGKGTQYNEGDLYSESANQNLFAVWKLGTYSITYDGNGATAGSVPDAGTYTTNDPAYVVSGNTGSLALPGYVFDGWNTEPDGTGLPFAPSASLTTTSDVILYAMWTPGSYVIQYAGNGSDSGKVPHAGSYTTEGPSYKVSGNSGSLGRTGYEFDGWNTAANGSGKSYGPGAPLTTVADVTLYAQWIVPAPQVCTISYDANGGVGSIDALVVECPVWATAAKASAISREGYSFSGWNTQADGTGLSLVGGANIEVTGDNTMYAMWAANPTGPTPGTDGTGPGGGSTVKPVDVVTPFETPVVIDPQKDNPPPSGQEWVDSCGSLIDPATGKPADSLVTAQGTWIVDQESCRVTFTPASGFVGKTSAEFRLVTISNSWYTSLMTVSVSPPAAGGAVTKMGATVYFASGSSRLTKEAKQVIKDLVEKARAAGTELNTKVIGYVQPVGGSSNNASLSEARAESVRDYLASLGVKHITTVKGLGAATETDWVARRAEVTMWVKPN